MARCILRKQRVSAIPADDVINVFHMKGGTIETAISAADAQALADNCLTAFVSNDVGVSTLLSGVATMEVYSLHDSPPRVPLAVSQTTAYPHSESPLPAELVVCASFQAAPISGVPQARRRGRLYLGPVGVGAMETTSITNDVNVGSTAQTDARLLLQDLADISAVTISTWHLAVYSGRADELGATVNDATVIATQGWVDNAFDIQRRRGAESNARVTFNIPA